LGLGPVFGNLSLKGAIAMIIIRKDKAKWVKLLYKIRVAGFSVSQFGYKTPFAIRLVSNLPKMQSSDLCIGLIYQFMQYSLISSFTICLGLVVSYQDPSQVFQLIETISET
jgi:hypothetical protein